MAVQPDELHRVRSAGVVDRPQRIAVAEVEPELRVVLAGGDELVGVCVDARGDAQHHAGDGPDASRSEDVEAIELVEGVDDDVAHLDLAGPTQLVARLVVAVQGAGDRAGTPAAIATWSSPPVATSSSNPSS